MIGWLPSGWVPPPEVPEDDVPAIEAGIKAVTAQLRRATKDEVAAVLAEMAVVLRTRDQLTAKAAVRLYAQHLGESPASVLKMACDHWVRTEEWFPSIAEFRKWCEAREKILANRLKRLYILREVAKSPAPDGDVTYDWHREIVRRAEARG